MLLYTGDAPAQRFQSILIYVLGRTAKVLGGAVCEHFFFLVF